MVCCILCVSVLLFVYLCDSTYKLESASLGAFACLTPEIIFSLNVKKL